MRSAYAAKPSSPNTVSVIKHACSSRLKKASCALSFCLHVLLEDVLLEARRVGLLALASAACTAAHIPSVTSARSTIRLRLAYYIPYWQHRHLSIGLRLLQPDL